MELDGDVTIVVPGERLGSLEQFVAGNGTYSRHGYVYSSLAGLKHVVLGQEVILPPYPPNTLFMYRNFNSLP